MSNIFKILSEISKSFANWQKAMTFGIEIQINEIEVRFVSLEIVLSKYFTLGLTLSLDIKNRKIKYTYV